MSDLSTALAEYISTLAASADRASRAEDRPIYTRHLAEAALMFSDLHSGSHGTLRERIESERHSYGWGYLTGDAGAAAEAAFDAFARLVESEANS